LGADLLEPASALAPSALFVRSDQIVPGPQQLRQQQKHEEKLKDIRDQVAQGKLVIRKMTDDERTLYPPREARPRGAKRR
jgi:hypothetical protein